MVLEIAVGIVLAVVLLALLPHIVAIGMWLVVAAVVFSLFAAAVWLVYENPELLGVALVVGSIIGVIVLVKIAAREIRYIGSPKKLAKTIGVIFTPAFTPDARIQKDRALIALAKERGERIRDIERRKSDRELRKRRDYHCELLAKLEPIREAVRHEDTVNWQADEYKLRIAVESGYHELEYEVSTELVPDMIPFRLVPYYVVRSTDGREAFSHPRSLRRHMMRWIRSGLRRLEEPSSI